MNRQDRLMDRARVRGQSEESQQAGFEGADRVSALKGSTAGQQLQQQGTETRRVQPDAPAQYREEYGFKMTDDQYGEYKAQETQWDTDMKKYETDLAGYQGDIDSARKGLDREKRKREAEIASAQGRLDKAAKTTTASLWNDAQNTFTEVRVVNGNQIEQTYRLPKAVVDKLGGALDEAYHSAWIKNDQGQKDVFNIDVQAKQGGGKRGKELHESLTSAVQDVHTEFINQALPNLQKNKSKIQSGYAQLNSARAALIGSYNDQLSELYTNETGVKGKQAEIANARSDYEAKLVGYRKEHDQNKAKRRALFGV